MEPLTERDFSRQVIDLARFRGWLIYHSWTSIHSPAGFPDLVMTRKGRLIFAELKRDKGKLTPAQEEWLAALRETAAGVYEWKPADWENIMEILK